MPTTPSLQSAPCIASTSSINERPRPGIGYRAAHQVAPIAHVIHAEADDLLCSALRGPPSHALLRPPTYWILHRHRIRTSGLRQRVVRVLSRGLAWRHGRT